MCKRVILEDLIEHPGSTPLQIAHRTGLDTLNVREMCSVMQYKGFVSGKYDAEASAAVPWDVTRFYISRLGYVTLGRIPIPALRPAH